MRNYEVRICKYKHPVYPTNYVIYYVDVDRQLCDFKCYCVEIREEDLKPDFYFSWFRLNHFSIIDERSGSDVVLYTRPPIPPTQIVIRPGKQLKLF